MDLPKAPAKDIRYGMLQPDCERKHKAWVVTLIEETIKDPTKKLILPTRFTKRFFSWDMTMELIPLQKIELGKRTDYEMVLE